jgi:hypothetical protein
VFQNQEIPLFLLIIAAGTEKSREFKKKPIDRMAAIA